MRATLKWNDRTKRTPWHPWPMRPARVGWYEIRGYNVDSGTLLCWNGTQWGYWTESLYEGHDAWVHWSDDHLDEWRGLSEPA